MCNTDVCVVHVFFIPLPESVHVSILLKPSMGHGTMMSVEQIRLLSLKFLIVIETLGICKKSKHHVRTQRAEDMCFERTLGA